MRVYVFAAGNGIKPIGSIEVQRLPKVGDEIAFQMGAESILLEVTEKHHFHEAIMKHCYDDAHFVACRLVSTS